MPPSRKITTKHTKSQVKKSLGFRPGTHYGTMLKNPTAKLQAFIYPKMSETNLKTLVKTLETADINQKNAMKKEATTKRLKAKEETELKKKLNTDIERAARRNARSRQFEEPSRNTFTVGDFGDRFLGPDPKYIILSILKKFQGKKIRIVAYNSIPGEEVRHLTKIKDKVSNDCMLVNENFGNGPMARNVYHRKKGEWVPTRNTNSVRGDKSYNIPTGNKQINKFFRDNHLYYHWVIQYPALWIQPTHPISLLNPGDIIKVFIIDNVKPLPTHRNQSFAQGISHCLLQPIIQDLTDKKDVAKSKKSKSNYNCGIKVLSRYEEKYRSGIPEDVLPELVEEVSKKIHINIEITVPLAIQQFINVRNSSGHGKTYKFINTRLDHVDLNAITLQNIQSQGRHRTFEIIDASREQILQIQKEHIENNMHIEWLCDKTGVTKLWSTSKVWKCNLDYSDTVANFEEDAGLHRLMIDHINDKDMSEFILAGTHYCCSVQFQTPPEDLTDIKCSDIHKSYAMSQQCRFYEECKFPNKLTRLSPTDSIQGPGLYLIKNIDWSQSTPKFVDLMKKEGDPIRDNNIYAVPILKLLDFHHVKYAIVMGCWAGGRVNTYDLKFSDAIVENKYYPMLVGKWNQIRETNSYFMRGSQELAGHMLRYAPNAEAEWCSPVNAWDPPEGIINIRYPKQHIWHLSHFTAYINAYEFVKMADQLMCCDFGKVIQIQKDDFMHYDHEFKMLPYFRDKTAEILKVDETGTSKAKRKVLSATPIDLSAQFEDFVVDTTSCYLHGVSEFQPECVSRMLAACVAHDLRNSHIGGAGMTFQRIVAPVVAHEGPGGTGKTDEALRNPRRQRVIYISPSHKLSRAKAREYNLCSEGDQILKEIEDKLAGLRKGDRKTLTNIKNEIKLQVTVWRRMLNENPEIWKKIDRYANTIIIDEVSMMWTETAQIIMDRFPNQEIVFAGDAGFQLPAFKTKEDEGPRTAFSAAKLNIPVIAFNKIFRVTCDRQLAIRLEGRELIKQKKSITEIEAFYMSHYRVVTSKEEVAQLYEAFSCENGIYRPKDLIICSTNEACGEWTDLLAPLQPVIDTAHIQKFHVKSCSRDLSNGEIVISIGPPTGVQSQVAHAFTAHSTIGETAPGKVFIDRRRMWETEHWETIVGRARRAEDIIIIDIPEIPSEKYSKNINYIISSEKGKISYIGSTTTGIETRKRGHESDKRCMSRKVMKYDDWKMEMIEEFPCASKKEAEARELYWIQKTPNCVNKNLLRGSNGAILSLEEPINMDKLQETIKFIKSRQHILLPVGKDRQNDKVREVLQYLEEMTKQPIMKDYYYSHGIGRLYVKGGSSTVRSKSMQGCFKGLRAALIGHIGHDIDIANSLPSLTVQWLDKLVDLGRAELSSDDFILLKDYVTDRALWLSQIQEFHGCDRDSAKKLVLVTLFGGDPKWHLKSSATLNLDDTFPRLQQLVEELISVRRKVVTFQNQLPKYRKLYVRKLQEKGSEEIAMRSAFAIYTQEIEDCVMEKIREYIWSQGVDIYSLIHDGLITSACSDELLRGAEDHIAQCGWHIRLAEKPLYGLQDQPIPELSPLY